jgi:hypothetical protein
MSTLAQLGDFKRLSTLELRLDGTNFPLAILLSLSKLPSLWKFALVVERDATVDAKLPATPKVYNFPHLRVLGVIGKAITVLRISQSIYGPGLLHIVLFLTSCQTPNTLNGCRERWPEMGPRILFYKIYLQPEISLPPNMFAPFLNNSGQPKFLEISSCTISVEHFCDLFDRARVGLWTALVSLKLRSSQPRTLWPEIDQMVPLSFLSMFAESCPRLRELELYLYYPLGEGDRENEDLENHIQGSQPIDHPLHDLEIEFLDPFVTVPEPGGIMEAIAVSRFIDHLFPSVQNISIFDGVSSVRELWYSGVKAMMKNYKDVRERSNQRIINLDPP